MLNGPPDRGDLRLPVELGEELSHRVLRVIPSGRVLEEGMWSGPIRPTSRGGGTN